MRFLLLFLLLELSLFASIGKISALNGKVVVDRQKQLFDTAVGFDLEEKDLVITDDKSKAQITLNDGTVLSLGKNSKLDINEYVFDEKDSSNSKANFKFAEGTFKSITGAIGKVAPEKFKLETKSASIGIRGTIVVGNQEKVACTQGQITVTSAGVTQVLGAGMMTNTETGKAPTPPTKIEGSLLKEVEIDSGTKKEESKSTTSATKEKTTDTTTEDNKKTNTENNSTAIVQNNVATTNIVNTSFTEVANNVNNTASDTATSLSLAAEEARKKAETAAALAAEEARKKAEAVIEIPFYNVTKTISSSLGQTVGTTEFHVSSEGSKVTIATYGSSDGTSNFNSSNNGIDPVLILLKEVSPNNFQMVTNGKNDDSWIVANNYYNSILSLNLSEGNYKILVSDFPFDETHAINGVNNGNVSTGNIELYISSTTPLTFKESTTSPNYNSSNNIAYIKNNIENTTISNKAEFGILADSNVGTSIAIKDYGVFVTISDKFISQYNNAFLDINEIDDGSSWGYWTSNLTNLSDIRNLKSVWISGNQVTPPSDYEANFNGQVIGGTSNGAHILLNSNNIFKGSISIGRGEISNSLIQFYDSSEKLWSGTFNTITNVNRQGFSSSIIGIETTGSLSGKYYGINGVVKSIGGEFTMINGNSTANGVFKAR